MIAFPLRNTKEQNRKEAFEEWLVQKKVTEKQERDAKREEALRKKYVEEDRSVESIQ